MTLSILTAKKMTTTLFSPLITIIPIYYGSYTYELTTPYGKGRSVRLILIEAMNATSMRDLNSKLFSRLERQTIMKGIIEAETSLYTHNVLHRDLHPRNVLVEQDSLRVIIVDFGAAVGRIHPGATLERKQIYLPGT